MQRSTVTRTLLPGLRRKDSIRRPTRSFYVSDLLPSRDSWLAKVLLFGFLLCLNGYLFHLHDQTTVDVGVKRFLREKVVARSAVPFSLTSSGPSLLQTSVLLEKVETETESVPSLIDTEPLENLSDIVSVPLENAQDQDSEQQH
jgi:hypothetical protein